jgi:hypothetical protein
MCDDKPFKNPPSHVYTVPNAVPRSDKSISLRQLVERVRRLEDERKARSLEWVAQNMPELLIIRDIARDQKHGRDD